MWKRGFFMLFCCLTFMGDAVAKTWTVGLEGPPTYDFSTIQEAIDAAAAGDTIKIMPGEYHENLLIEKSVVLWGAGKSDEGEWLTSIEGRVSPKPVIDIWSCSEIQVEIKGLSISNTNESLIVVRGMAKLTLQEVMLSGGWPALYVLDSSQAEVKDSFIEARHQRGGVTALHNGHLMLQNVEIKEGPIDLMDSTSSEITQCVMREVDIDIAGSANVMIRGSQIGEDSELQIKESAQVVIENCSINGSTFSITDSARVIMEDSTITRPITRLGEAVAVEVRGGKSTFTNCLIEGSDGDGIRVEAGDCTLVNCLIKGNGDSGVELLGGSLVVQGGEISDNGTWGIFQFGGKLDHRGVRFQGNKLGPLSPRAQTPRPLYLDPSQPIEVRVEDLLSRMTLEEKAAQLDIVEGAMVFRYFERPWWFERPYILEEPGMGSVLPRLFAWGYPSHIAELMNEAQLYAIEHTRLGIPLLMGTDCPLGASVKGGTIFPCGIGMASTWDPELIQTVGSIIAKESRALGVHQTYSPVLDLCRDPRWGRVEETLGEDPYLASVLGAAMVRGLQGESLNTDHTVIATPKHFVGYGRVLGGRNGSFESVSERELKEIYLPPFEAAIKTGARSIMSAYSELNGVPCVASEWLLTKVLREEWGFKGFVTTDWECIEDLWREFRVAETFGDAIAQALQAGADLHMLTHRDSLGDFQRELVKLVESGKLPEEVVDEAVRRILHVKFELGLFERPFVDTDRAAEIVGCEEHKEVALQVARESLVLLKNEDEVLPLSKDIGSIAFIDLNDDAEAMLGWGYDWVYGGTTVLEGIQGKVPSEVVHVISGWELERSISKPDRYPEPLEAIKSAEVAIVVAGEPGDWTGETWPGHERDRASLQLPEGQLELIKAVHDTGTPTVVVILSGRPLAIEWLADHIPAILWTWKPGPAGGQAIADVLFGDYNPSGKLPISFPYNVGQIPVFYNWHPHTRRTDYIEPYIPARPLFPFGHGLSYTKFEYSNLTITPEEIELSDDIKIRVSVDVQNVGDREGTEVVQLYLRDVVASVVRPVMELKGFERVTLRPGEKRTINFILTYDHLAFYNRDMVRVIEPGTFEVMIGSSSEDIQLKGSFEVKKP